MRNISLIGKIKVFKSSAFSKIVSEKYYRGTKTYSKKVFMVNKKVKIKYDTLCNDYKDEGLKSVNMAHKISALNCS